ncbi:MAG: helix-turn-helix domain-containing protein [Myxococcales bacterium]|nr:helix-turn-helix domain-containing protein [Myxococcales bacterium]
MLECCLCMRGPDARPIFLPLSERPRLEALASQQQAPFEVVRRARIVQLLAGGKGPAEVARPVGCSERNVYKWRARREGHPAIESLQNADRPGRPATVPMSTRCRTVQLACDRP